MIRNTFLLSLFFLLAARAAPDDLRLDLAKKWEQAGQFDRAAQELRLHLSEYPDDAASYEWLGDLRMRMGQTAGAVENYRAGVQRDPTRSALQAKLAVALEKSGDKNGAIDVWRKMSETAQDPTWVKQAKQNLDRIAQGRPLPVSPPAASAPTPTPATASKVIPASNSGHTAADQDEPESEAASDRRPPSGIYAMPEFNAAIGQYRAGHKEDALKTLRQVLNKSPGHPGAYYLGGVIRYDRGELDKAVYDFKRSTAYPDKGFNAYFYLGRIYQKQGRNREAIAAFENYLKATRNEIGRKQAQAYLDALRRQQVASAPAAGVEKTKPMPHPLPTSSRDSTVKKATAAPAAKKPAETMASAYPIGGGILFVISDTQGPGVEALEAAHEDLAHEKIEHAVQALKAVQVQFAGSPNAEAVAIDLAAVYLKLGLWEQGGAQTDDYLARHAGGRFERYARYLKALVLVGQGKGGEALPLLQSVETENGFGPPVEEVSYHMARASEGSPKVQAAYLVQAEKGIKDAARLLWIRQKLGAFWAQQGEAAKAADYYRKSLDSCSDTALAAGCLESTVQLGDLEFRLHALQPAMDAYRELLHQYPHAKEAAWAQYQIGNVLKTEGDWDGALQAYQLVIDNYPDSYWAAQAKWQKDDAVWRKEYQGVLH